MPTVTSAISNRSTGYESRALITHNTNMSTREVTFSIDIQVRNYAAGYSFSGIRCESAIKVGERAVVATYNNPNMTDSVGTWRTVATLTDKFTRDANGNPKSVKINTSFSGFNALPHVPWYMNTTTTVTLESIVKPVAAQITKIPQEVNVGSTITIESNSGTGVTRTLEYALNDTNTFTQIPGTGTSWTLTAPQTAIQANNTYGWIRLRLTSRADNKVVGSPHILPVTIRIPASNAPDRPSLTVEDAHAGANALFRGAQFVQGVSIPKVTMTTVAKGGATVASRTVTFQGSSYSVGTGATNLNPPSKAETSAMVAYFTDSRGMRSANLSRNITVHPYRAPLITSANFYRTSAGSNQANLSINCSVSSLKDGSSEKNTMSVRWRVRPSDSNSWGTWQTFTTTGLSYNNRQAISGNFDVAKSFVFELEVIDKLNTTRLTQTLATESVLVSYNKTVVGIGMIAETGKQTLQVGGSGVLATNYRTPALAVDMPLVIRPNGYSHHYNAAAALNLNTITQTRMFTTNSPTNKPDALGGINKTQYIVWSNFENDDYGGQLLMTKSDGDLYFRDKHGANNWTPYKRVLTNRDVSKFVGTSHGAITAHANDTNGWITNSKIQYRTRGGVVGIRFNVTVANGDITKPANGTPYIRLGNVGGYTSSSNYFIGYIVASSTAGGSTPKNIQLNSNGDVIIWNPIAGATYSFSTTVMA